MRFGIFLVVVLTLCGGDEVKSQESFLDRTVAPFFRMAREAFNSFIQPRTFKRGLAANIKSGKVQPQLPGSTSFFCDVNGPGGRSTNIPQSVHKLRLGDIDIIGAIGDSLTAGNGAFANDVLQVLLEGRGASWAIGGQKTWRNFLTIPNIIKEFNPNLYGYSITDQGRTYDKLSKFNVAEPGAMSEDTVHQAKNLVKRMRSDSKVNMKKHWKLITYMIGGNDFCLDICYTDNQDKVLQKMGENLVLTLRIIRENLPRSLVNVVLPPDVSILTKFVNKPDECKSLHYLECPCLFSLNHLRDRERTFDTIRRWKSYVTEIVRMPEFHARNDFEVTLHPFLDLTDIPKDASGSTDFSYMSTDCFHLSQLGHARAANAYYNSMLTPERERLRYWTKEFDNFLCPTQQRPFLTTSKNS